MIQAFTNITYQTAYADGSSKAFNDLNQLLNRVILPAYQSVGRSVTGLALIQVHRESVIATYDVYSNHSEVTGISLVEFYKETIRRSGAVAANLGAQIPKPG